MFSAFFLLADNLLVNPGFEFWTENNPDNWTYESGITVYSEEGTVHGGNFSLKDSLITQTQDNADLVSELVKVTPGALCTLRVWVYDNDPAGRLRLSAFWNSGDSDYDSYSVDSEEWQQLEMEVNAPFTADSGRLAMRAYDTKENWDGDAVFYIDDAEFITTTTPVPPFIKRIWHKPTHPLPAYEENVYAEILDDGNITDDSLYYGINNPDPCFGIYHSAINGDTFLYSIPCQAEGDTVFYYLWVKDDYDSITVSDTNAYYVGNKGIVINEVCYDIPGSDTACFIELYGFPGASLDGIEVVGVNGLNGEDYEVIDLTGYSIPPDGFFVIAQDSCVANADTITDNVDLQNGPDNIELRFNGIAIDALGYGSGDFIFTGEGLPAPDIEDTNSLSRYPNGEDTDNNVNDFVVTLRSPGEETTASVEEIYSETPFELSFSSVMSGQRANFVIDVRKKGDIDFSIFNVLGQRVFEFKKDFLSPTSHKIEWNTKDVCPGVYFCRLNFEETNLTEKVLILK
ncbi:T9SS type A sorting domain-containing protein [candidate division WOR-3 bacterium]|nr:T9SS type A sorting domain-containing protein [candidate division WOR-3 bacterium]